MQKSTRKIRPKLGLRQRIRAWYRNFNQENWEHCFRLIDPRLRRKSRVDFETYAKGLGIFRACYGQVRILFIQARLVTKVQSASDTRDFAYVLILWEDKDHSYHLFRERWIKDRGRWYTRVVGLVAHEKTEKNELS